MKLKKKYINHILLMGLILEILMFCDIAKENNIQENVVKDFINEKIFKK